MEYNINLKIYEGPMDLLISLIKKNEIDIYDIPIYLITEQFLEYIEEANKINLELTSDFILMASTLIEIKSKMLLPKIKIDDEQDDEDEDPRDDLVQKILEYEMYKEISQKFKESASYESKAFYKLKEDFSNISEIDLLKNCTIDTLAKSLNNLLKRVESENQISEIRKDNFPVEKATLILKERLKREEAFLFSDLLSEQSFVEEVVSYFLSILELVKIGYIKANQYNNYQDIEIIKRKENCFE